MTEYKSFNLSNFSDFLEHDNISNERICDSSKIDNVVAMPINGKNSKSFGSMDYFSSTDSLESPIISELNSYMSPNPIYNKTRVKRASTTINYIKPPNPNKTNSYQPVTSSSYRSCPTNEAVSYLSYFADTTAKHVSETSPDQEGEEINNYVLGQLIGNGAFSVVRKAYTTLSDHSAGTKQLSVKIVKKQANNEEAISRIESEIQIWKLLDHPYILKFIDSIENDYGDYVFMEYCSNGTLLKELENKKVYLENEAKPIALQLCKAIKYLHENLKIIHGDIKLENILFDDKMNVKLSDFGLSRFDSEEIDTNIISGTVAYCSPEKLKGTKPRFCSDIWSLGVVLFAMCSGTLPFNDCFEPRLIKKIISCEYDLPDHFSKPLVDLITKIFCIDSQDRITIEEIISHSWFKSQ